MIALAAIALLGQVPEVVTETGAKMFASGGFAAVAAVLGAGCALGFWLFFRERAANGKLAEASRLSSEQAGQAIVMIQGSLSGVTGALATMSHELRILGDRLRDLERRGGP